MPNVVEMTQAAYARHCGVTPKAVEKAIAARRIPASAVRREGRSVLIDVAAADLADWRSAGVRVNTPAAGDLAGDSAPSSSAAEMGATPAKETPALTAARTEAAQIQARMAQLALDERLGKLINADEVARAMERCAEAVVRDVDQLSARADDLVTAFTRNGVAGVRALLKEISRGMRETLANNMRLLAADDRDDEAGDDEASIAADETIDQAANDQAPAEVAA